MRKKGFTLIELLIAIAIGGIVVAVSYTLLNHSSIALNKNINYVENQLDINTLTKIITQDIKMSKNIIENNKIDDIEYNLIFLKKYGDKNIYKLVRKQKTSEMVLFNYIVENGFAINKKEGNLYEVIVKYFENNQEKEHKFYVSKKLNSFSIEKPIIENPTNNLFDYKGYFVTIDFAKDPKAYMIESNSYNSKDNNPSSNSLKFEFLSKGEGINSNYDLMIVNEMKNLGYDFKDSIFDDKYNNPQPFEIKYKTNGYEINKVNGIYIKNIDKLDGKDKNTVEIDASGYLYGYDLFFTVELSDKINIYRLDKKGNSNHTNSYNNIKIEYNDSKKLHINGKLELFNSITK